ncbi:hypothetical protein HWV62_8094 [Athelia sp. TMB]|nr:hypothetical protein HWV62_8094 [Athelia sp. TMB]
MSWCAVHRLGLFELSNCSQYNPTSTICWTIHRPKRGWYIRIRAPSFPPGVYIPLLPVPKVSPYHAEAAISFACRTNISRTLNHDSGQSITSPKPSTDSDSTLVHSYPPSPPTPSVVLQPPSPTSIDAKLQEVDISSVPVSTDPVPSAPASSAPIPSKRVSQPPRPPNPASRVTQFILTPHSTAHIPQPESPSLFTRALSALKNSKPSHSSSFTLSPMASTSATPPAQQHSLADAVHLPPRPKPLLTFHDHTPILTVRSVTGLLEIEEQDARLLGVETSFWVAVALTYLEFLEEREASAKSCLLALRANSWLLQSYLAAIAD